LDLTRVVRRWQGSPCVSEYLMNSAYIGEDDFASSEGRDFLLPGPRR
jgi:hypothetical protein